MSSTSDAHSRPDGSSDVADAGNVIDESGEAASGRSPRGSGRRKRAPRSRRRKLAIFLTVLGSLLLVIVLVVVGFLWKLGSTFDHDSSTIQGADPGDYSGRPASTGAYNVLLMGSDSRKGEADAATVSGQRSDALMLLHVPADGGAAYVISIMRDTWVSIPGHGKAKINAALDYGGVALEVRTVEQLLDTRIDHVAEIDFEGFRDLTDAVGGVTVDVPMTFSTREGVKFTKGEQTLDGERALAFVRERYAFSDGDYQRVKDQRIYLRALLHRMLSAQTLANPVRLNQAVEKFSPYVSVDSGLTATEIVKIAAAVGPSGFNHLTMFTLPNSGTGWSSDGQSIVVADQAAITQLSKALADGTMADYAKTVTTD